MSKQEFLSQLAALLAEIPNDEKAEALRYYEDYFEDAEDQSEEEVVKKLGTPEKIAKQIKLDLYNKASKEGGVYTESGYVNTYYEEEKKSPEVTGTKQNYNQNFYNNYNQNAYDNQPYGAQDAYRADYGPHRSKNTNIALIVLLIVTAPIWGSAAFGILAGIFGTLVGITFGTFGAAMGLGIGGIVCIGYGICMLCSAPMSGVIGIGIGFILIAIALLFMVLFSLIVTRLIPWIIGIIKQLIKQIFQRGGR